MARAKAEAVAEGTQFSPAQLESVELAELAVSRRTPGGVLEWVRVSRGRPNLRRDAYAAGFSDGQAAAWKRDARLEMYRGNSTRRPAATRSFSTG
jgi:hypothetical protein